MFDDDQETPNTMTASFEFDEGGKKKMLEFEVRHWISNGEAGIEDVADPMAGPAAGTRTTVGNVVYGSKGYLSTARPGFKIWLGREQQPGPAPTSRARRRQLGEFHPGGSQPQAVRPERPDRGRRAFRHPDSPGQHLLPSRPHACTSILRLSR